MQYPESLKAETLLSHMQAISKGIGPRPATSDKEREASEYVKTSLQNMGYAVGDIAVQPFKSQP